MRKIKLTESQLKRIVKRVISESESEFDYKNIEISDIELERISTILKMITIKCLPKHEEQVYYQLRYDYTIESNLSQDDYSFVNISFKPESVFKINPYNIDDDNDDDVVDHTYKNEELMKIFENHHVKEWVHKNLIEKILEAEKNEGSDY